MRKYIAVIILAILCTSLISVYAEPQDQAIEEIINAPPNPGYSCYINPDNKTTFKKLDFTQDETQYIVRANEFRALWFVIITENVTVKITDYRSGSYDVIYIERSLEPGCYLFVPYADSTGALYCYIYKVTSAGIYLVSSSEGYNKYNIHVNATNLDGVRLVVLYREDHDNGEPFDSCLNEAIKLANALDSNPGDSSYSIAWGKFSGNQPIKLNATIGSNEFNLFTWGGGSEPLYTVHIFRINSSILLESNNKNYTLEPGKEIRIEDENFFEYTPTNETEGNQTTSEVKYWVNATAIHPADAQIELYINDQLVANATHKLSYQVAENTTVKVRAYKSGYKTYETNIVVKSDICLGIVLEYNTTITDAEVRVTAVPSDAVVEIYLYNPYVIGSTSGLWLKSRGIGYAKYVFKTGDFCYVKVSREGYSDFNTFFRVLEDTSLTVNLLTHSVIWGEVTNGTIPAVVSTGNFDEDTWSWTNTTQPPPAGTDFYGWLVYTYDGQGNPVAGVHVQISYNNVEPTMEGIFWTTIGEGVSDSSGRVLIYVEGQIPYNLIGFNKWKVTAHYPSGNEVEVWTHAEQNKIVEVAVYDNEAYNVRDIGSAFQMWSQSPYGGGIFGTVMGIMPLLIVIMIFSLISDLIGKRRRR